MLVNCCLTSWRIVQASDAYITMLPAAASPDELTALVSYLQDAQLVDDLTRSIEVRMAVYNGNTDVIGECVRCGELAAFLLLLRQVFCRGSSRSTWLGICLGS